MLHFKSIKRGKGGGGFRIFREVEFTDMSYTAYSSHLYSVLFVHHREGSCKSRPGLKRRASRGERRGVGGPRAEWWSQ